MQTKQQPPSGQPTPEHQSKLDVAGRIVGLVASVVFMVLALILLFSPAFSRISQGEQAFFLFFVILFSGPIIHFWVTAGTHTQLGLAGASFTIGGGYAGAIILALVVFKYLMPDVLKEQAPATWKHLTVASEVHELDKLENVAVTGDKGSDHVYLNRDGSRVEIVVCFDQNVPEVAFTFHCILPTKLPCRKHCICRRTDPEFGNFAIE